MGMKLKLKSHLTSIFISETPSRLLEQEVNFDKHKILPVQQTLMVADTTII